MQSERKQLVHDKLEMKVMLLGRDIQGNLWKANLPVSWRHQNIQMRKKFSFPFIVFLHTLYIQQTIL